MKARQFVALALVLALAASNPVQASTRSPRQPLLTAPGAVKLLALTEWKHGSAAPGRVKSADSLGPLRNTIAIAAGWQHTCALTAGGGVRCWGYNGYGQLGDRTTSPRGTAVDVFGPGSGVVDIAAGAQRTCALMADGGVKCWGMDRYWEASPLPAIDYRTKPEDVIGLESEVAAITAGLWHACALMAHGGVMCWGHNWDGQLGDGTTTERFAPVGVVELESGVAAIAAGDYHTCALMAGGGVKCWGSNRNGQLGAGTGIRGTPVDVVGLESGVAAIAAGGEHTCALTADGGVKCWGRNDSGQLGNGATGTHFRPVDVVGLGGGVTAINVGNRHTCAVTEGGGVKCWGSNSSGQLGDGTTISSRTPVDVVGLVGGVAAIAAGESHTCAVTAGGGVKCWGSNRYGQLGDGTMSHRLTPADVVALGSTVAAVAAGEYHTCALTTGGGVKCWGSNGSGQLGDGTTTRRSAPVDVVGLGIGVAAIAAGTYHTCALTAGGGVKCWGSNSYGQLGDGTTIISSSMPVDVVGLESGVVAIAAGHSHSCAVTTGGGVKCWGCNYGGQVGDGTTTHRSTPVDVVGLVSGASAVTAGGEHTCALTAGGGVKCWGSNSSGQLGDGLVSEAAAIAAGAKHTCALTTGGGVECWGQNWFGQLGDGTWMSSSTPVDAIGLASGVTAISAGDHQTCAVARGAAKCWGENGYGQLGDETTTRRCAPMDVFGLGSGVAAISAGTYHTCAVTTGGELKCWGWDGYGQLGLGTITYRTQPVDVLTLVNEVYLPLILRVRFAL